jgi:hypothetical protein
LEFIERYIGSVTEFAMYGYVSGIGPVTPGTASAGIAETVGVRDRNCRTWRVTADIRNYVVTSADQQQAVSRRDDLLPDATGVFIGC